LKLTDLFRQTEVYALAFSGSGDLYARGSFALALACTVPQAHVVFFQGSLGGAALTVCQGARPLKDRLVATTIGSNRVERLRFLFFIFVSLFS
jgi:hypothetical protein